MLAAGEIIGATSSRTLRFGPTEARPYRKDDARSARGRGGARRRQGFGAGPLEGHCRGGKAEPPSGGGYGERPRQRGGHDRVVGLGEPVVYPVRMGLVNADVTLRNPK